MHLFMTPSNPLYVVWTNACMHVQVAGALSPSLPPSLSLCVCMCVCNGLVGVTLGDGQQPPIGRDLKRHTLFFFCEQRLDTTNV